MGRGCDAGNGQAVNPTASSVYIGAAATGFETAAQDIPTTGTATFTGATIGAARRSGQGYILAGEATVTADFANRGVSGQLFNMVATEATTLAQTSWNTVNLTGSWAAGSNTFNGTTAVTAANANPAGMAGNATGDMAAASTAATTRPPR